IKRCKFAVLITNKMKTIFKTWRKATYLHGTFGLREDTNFAHPIEFPTVFEAYSKAIKSGNWMSCTSINTPNYVIKYYFDTIGDSENDAMYQLWVYCKQLSVVNWGDLQINKEAVLNL